MSIQQMFFCLTSVYYSPYMDQAGDLFDFTSFTFTNGGATGRNGPTSFSGDATYTSQAWYSTYFTVSAGIQYWYAPATGNYTIRAAGAAGHNGYYSNRCRGIIIESTVTLEKGMLYKIMIGQKGSVYSNGSGGGGGGTFLTEYFNVPIIISGGGAGSVFSNSSYSSYSNSDGQSGTSGANSVCGTGLGGSNGNGGNGSSNGWGGGGGGLYGNGTDSANVVDSRGISFVGGGTGGNTRTSAYGGFGGGAGTHGNTGGGGGGGGYSGGGGSNQSFVQNVGGGGGSYSQTAITEIGYNTGHGYLTITRSS